MGNGWLHGGKEELLTMITDNKNMGGNWVTFRYGAPAALRV